MQASTGRARSAPRIVAAILAIALACAAIVGIGVAKAATIPSTLNFTCKWEQQGSVYLDAMWRNSDHQAVYCADRPLLPPGGWNGPGTHNITFTGGRWTGNLMVDYILYHGYTGTVNGFEQRPIFMQTQRALWAVLDNDLSHLDRVDSGNARELYNAAKAWADAGGNGPERGTSAIYFSGDSQIQNVVVFMGVKSGKAAIEKVSANPAITNGNACYSLEGIQYGIYDSPTDFSREHLKGVITLDASGKGTSGDLEPGTYYLREGSTNNSNYAWSDAVHKVEVKAGTTSTVKVEDMPENDPTGAIVQKLGSSSKVSLKGTQFTVRYFDNEEGVTSGDPERTWVFEADEDGFVLFNQLYYVSGNELYLDADGDTCLPVGSFEVTETKPAPGYRISDPEPHSFIVRGGGNYSKNPTIEPVDWVGKYADQLEPEFGGRGFYDETQPEIRTTATESGSHYATSIGKVTIVDVVECKRLVVGKTYKVTGELYDKKTGESLGITAEGEEFVADAEDMSVEVTFTADASKLSGKKTVAFETLYEEGIEIAVHADLEDEAQTVTFPKIGTTAKIAGEHEALYQEAVENGEFLLVDTVAYEGLEPGKEHTITGELYDKETGESIGVSAEATFVPESESGTYDLEFVVPEELLYGKVTVAFEEVSRDGRTLAVHADIDDEGQTVRVPKIRTTAADPVDGDQHIVQGTSVKVTDTIRYEGLIAGKEYVVSGTLMDKETGEPVFESLKGEDGTVKMTISTLPADALKLARDKVVEANPDCVVSEVVYIDGMPAVYVSTGVQQGADEEGNPIAMSAIKVEFLEVDAKAEETEVTFDETAFTATEKFVPEGPDGEVTITFDVPTELLAGKAVVAFESVTRDGREIALHADLEDDDQTVHVPEIGTTLTDDEGDKVVSAHETVKLVDVVAYEGLIAGKTYTLTGTLHDKATGEQIGEPVEVTFEAESAKGEVEVTFEIDGELVAGKDVVAFESASCEGIEVAVHADIDDEGQTVKVPKIGTTLETSDGKKKAPYTGTITLVDTVAYENLVPGVTYTLKGELRDKSTGQPLGITAESTFTPKEAMGTAQVSFKVDASKLAGKTVVAYEKVYEKDVEVAIHADINDAAQTVEFEKTPTTPGTPSTVRSLPKTGTDAANAILAIMAGAGALGGAIAIRKASRKGEDA